MKLSTLLLSSAALVVAGSAYAADLPAKKGAPAAKAATGCPAFGAGFFQIPGGDTCIKFSGAVYADVANSTSTSIAGTYDFYFDVRSNSDAGTIRGFAGTSGGTLVDKAYVQFGGLSAGHQNFITKIYGVGGNQGGAQYGNPSDSVYYSTSMGNATVSIGIANPGSHTADDDKSPDVVTTNKPDIAAALSLKAGAADISVAAVSHEATDQTTLTTANGYAVLGKVGFSANGFGIAGFGGYANGATSYINAGAAVDAYDAGGAVNYELNERYDDSNVSGTAAGLEATYTMGSIKFGVLYATAGLKNSDYSGKNDQINVWADYSVAKGLTITPEVLQTNIDVDGDKSSTNTFYVRIKRDF